MQVQQGSFTRTLVEKRFINPYMSGFAGVKAIPQMDSIQFGSSQRPKFWLLEEEPPVFLLHGTSHRGEVMEPWADYLRQEIGWNSPVYVSCLPEIEKATGIEKPAKATMQPAYLALLRDLAEFRVQLIGQRMTELRMLSQCTDEGVACQFKVRPQDATWLVPIIREYILKPITQVPKNWHPTYQQPLRTLVRKSITQIQHESQKLESQPTSLKVIDSEFLHRQAQAEGKMPVTRKVKRTPSETVNPRPLALKSLNFIEGYLLAMQQELTQALQSGTRFSTAEKGRAQAEKTAQHLMDVIAPRVLLIGHSQGGTVILTALLQFLQQQALLDDMAYQDPNDFPMIAAQGMRSAFLFSAPLKGIPDFPGWGESLSQYLEKVANYVHVFSEQQLTDLVKHLIWAAKSADKPAVLEMKAGSDLMRKLSVQLHSLAKWKGTVVSAFDQKDGYVEPTVSRLSDPDGRQLPNFFNLELQNEMLPPVSIKPEDALNFISKQIPVAGPLLRRLAPYRWQEFMRDFYVNDMVGDGSKPSLEQHRALLMFPKDVNRQLDQQLLENEQSLIQILDIQNDELFRKAALNKLLKTVREEKKKGVFRKTVELHPFLLKRVVQNAEEDMPLLNSASSVAQQILREIAK